MSEKQNHFEKYSGYYFVGGALVLGIIIGRALNNSSFNVPITNNNNPVIHIPVTNSVSLGGYATKLVKCLETGQIWETVKDAANSAGVSSSMMSQHINGHKDHISKMHYEIIGLGV